MNALHCEIGKVERYWVVSAGSSASHAWQPVHVMTKRGECSLHFTNPMLGQSMKDNCIVPDFDILGMHALYFNFPHCSNLTVTVELDILQTNTGRCLSRDAHATTQWSGKAGGWRANGKVMVG